MKKSILIVTVLLICTLLFGCAPQVVKDGAMICREDFNIYKDGEEIENADETTIEVVNSPSGIDYLDGSLTIISKYNGTTARNITVGDSVDKMLKAYENSLYTTEKGTLGDTSYIFKYKGYELEFDTKDGEIQAISMRSPEYVKANEEFIDQLVAERLQ